MGFPNPLKLIAKIGSLIPGPIGAVVNTFLNKETDVALTPEQRATLDMKIKEQVMATMDEAQQADADWREFMLAYEGAAEDQHLAIKILRGSVRPIITYAVVIELFVLLNGWATITTEGIPSPFWTIAQMVLGFWFGGRMLEGVIQSVKQGRKT